MRIIKINIICESPIEWDLTNPDLGTKGGRFPLSKIYVQFGMFDADVVSADEARKAWR